MNLEVNQLIEQLVATKGKPHPNLLHTILAKRDTAIPPLMAFLDQEDSLDVSLWGPELVIQLLGSLKAREAIPSITKAFHHKAGGSFDIYVAAGNALANLEAVDVMFQLLKDGTVNAGARELLVTPLQDLAAQSPHLWPKITVEFRSLLDEYVKRVSDLSDEEISVGRELMYALTYLGDEEAADLIARAGVTSGNMQWAIVYLEDLCYPGGLTRNVQIRNDWLDEYTKSYASK